MMFKLFTILLILFTAHTSWAVLAPSVMTYHGRVIAPNSMPLEADDVTFTIQILSPGVESCVLYEETHFLDMTDSEGMFSLNIGRGTVTLSDPGLGLLGSLNNSVSKSGLNCTSGTTYTPVGSDARKMNVTFDYTGSTGPVTVTPAIEINGAPYANYASMLEGLGKSDFLQVNSGGTMLLNQANIEAVFTDINYPLLISAISGSHTAYAKASDLPVVGGTLNMSGGGQDIIVNDLPASGDSAVNKDYSDSFLGGKTLDGTSISGLTGSSGNGYTIVWDEATQTFIAAPASNTDNTKLPLAGGTMSGAINMNGQNILATGHITMSPETTINMGNYTTVQETALVGVLGAVDKGKTWFNSSTNLLMVWNGTAAVTSGVQLGDTTGTALEASDILSCANNQKLQRSVGPTYSWSCIPELGDIEAVTAGLGLSGGGTAGTASLDVNVDDTSIEIDTDTLRLKAGGVGNSHLANNSVSNDKLIDSVVNSAKIADGSVNNIDMADNAINSIKIQDGTITSADILNETIASADILDGTISLSDMGANSVNSGNIVDGSITGADLAAGTVGDSNISGVAVDKITSGAGKYFTYLPNNTACSNGEILSWDSANTRWVCAADGGITDHGVMNGLLDDDHAQYVMLAGRTGGQTINGGTAAGNDLILDSTSNASKGDIVLNPSGGNVGIGTTSPSTILDVEGAGVGEIARFQTSDSNGTHAFITVKGARNASVGGQTSSINFSNYDSNEGGGTEYISGQVSGYMTHVDGERGGLQFLTNDGLGPVTRATLNNKGNFGVGDNNPANKLTVYGTRKNGTNLSDAIAKIGGDDVHLGFGAMNGTPNYNTWIQAERSSDNAAFNLALNPNGGDVGVGTITPNTALTVDGTVRIGNGGETCGVTFAGAIRYNASTIQFCNGTSWLTMSSTGAGDNLGNHTATTNLNMATNSILGGTASGDDLILESTSNATKGDIILNPTSGNVGVGTTSPSAKLDILQNNGANFALEVNHNGGTVSRHGLKVTSTGTSSTSSLLKLESASNPNAMHVRADGFVGIGTTNPDELLHLDAGTAGTAIIHLESNSGGANSYIKSWSSGNHKMSFGSGSLPEIMTLVNGSGNVGIGTTSPDAKFEVNTATLGSTINDTVEMQRISGGNGNLNYLDFKQIRTAAGSDWLSAGTRIQEKIDSTWMGYLQFNGNGNHGGISFGVGQTTTAPGNVSEAMRIDGAGNIGIGVTNPQQRLQVNGSIYLGNNTANSYVHSGLDLGLQADSEVRIVSDVNDTSGVGATDIIFGYGSSTNTDVNTDFTQAELGTYPRVELMRIDSSSGNVGIGTVIPASKLDVDGTIKVGAGSETCSVAADGGMIKYSAGDMYMCDGSSWQALLAGAGADNLGNHTATANIH